MSTATLCIVNKDATPKQTEFNVDISAIYEVVTWYSAYAAGDHYKVYVNGVVQELDHNGRVYEEPLT